MSNNPKVDKMSKAKIYDFYYKILNAQIKTEFLKSTAPNDQFIYICTIY